MKTGRSGTSLGFAAIHCCLKMTTCQHALIHSVVSSQYSQNRNPAVGVSPLHVCLNTRVFAHALRRLRRRKPRHRQSVLGRVMSFRSVFFLLSLARYSRGKCVLGRLLERSERITSPRLTLLEHHFTEQTHKYIPRERTDVEMFNISHLRCELVMTKPGVERETEDGAFTCNDCQAKGRRGGVGYKPI